MMTDPIPITVNGDAYRKWYSKTQRSLKRPKKKLQSILRDDIPIVAIAVSGYPEHHLVLVKQGENTWFMPSEFIRESVFDLLNKPCF